MIVDFIEREITNFLVNDEPEVLCLSGQWGVGKTYIWREVLSRYVKAGKYSGRRHYSYVSLFGINSIDQLKSRLFESRVTIEDSTKPASIETFSAGIKKIKSRWPAILGFMQGIPKVGSIFGADGGVLTFLCVRNQIICLDDLERSGKGLDVKDILGLVSELKERQNCKIILLLNKDAFDERQLDGFLSNLEKVTDRKIEFLPDALYSARAVLSEDDPIENIICKNCILFGISNIRIIVKIKKIVHRLSPLLTKYETEVLSNYIKSIVVIVWSIFQKDTAPSIEFLQKRNGLEGLLQRSDEPKPEEIAWNALLNAADFGAFDDVDRLIAKGVESGFFDEKVLGEALTVKNKEFLSQKSKGSFSEAWRIYHDNFADNQDEVFLKLRTAFSNFIDQVSPMDLDSTIRLFKDMKYTKEADAMLSEYMSKRVEPLEFWDISNYPFSEQIKDKKLINAFKKRLAELAPDRNMKEILLKIDRTKGWSPDEIKFLSACKVSDFVQLFTQNTDSDLRSLISASLQFGKIGGIPREATKISELATDALRKIAGTSRLNAFRVRRYGIYPYKPSAK